MTKVRAPNFDLEKTLSSGQVFHWDKIDNRADGSRARWAGGPVRVDEPGGESTNGFVGAIGGAAVYVEQRGEKLFAAGASAQKIRNYFALDHPLADICRSFPDDPVMRAARESCAGLRIIRQPKWECLAMFICSSMKQVAHIRQISRKLRERFGEKRCINVPRPVLHAPGGSAAPRAMLRYSASPTFINIEQGTARSTNPNVVFTFPSAARLAQSSEMELRECALGYRAKNLLATARLISSSTVDLSSWEKLSDETLREKLCGLPGVGAKVANCVMLFAYERLRAFPIDVWIERVLREKYFARKRKVTTARLRDFTEKYFGAHGGYAQQYLFHHARTTNPKRQNRPRDSSTSVGAATFARNDKRGARSEAEAGRNLSRQGNGGTVSAV